jgi:hypothetical protein
MTQHHEVIGSDVHVTSSGQLFPYAFWSIYRIMCQPRHIAARI